VVVLAERGHTQVARKQGKLLDVTPGRHQVFHEEPDDTFTIETRQDAQAIVDANKRKFNDYGDKLSVGKRGEFCYSNGHHCVYLHYGRLALYILCSTDRHYRLRWS
jgi:DNA gyrase inhibitor GyrI